MDLGNHTIIIQNPLFDYENMALFLKLVLLILWFVYTLKGLKPDSLSP